jgi:hypothetical protein
MNIPTPGIYGQRVLLWVGIVCAVLYGFAYVVLLEFLPPPAPLLDAESVVALYAHNNIQFRIGAGLMIFTGAFAVPMSITIAIQMARLEKGFPYLATLQILTSLVGAWIFVWPAVIWNVCAFTANRSPEITVSLHQLAWLTFVTPGSFFWMQVGSVGLVALVGRQDVPHSAFPRWFGWFSLFAALEMSLPPTFAGVFWTGPFAWNGLITFYLTIVNYGLWLTAMMVLLFKALRGQGKDG